MNKLIYFFFLIILGCDTFKEESTTVHNLLENNTIHTLTLSFFKDGSEVEAEAQTLLPFEKKEVLLGRERGKGQGLTYAAILNEISDSCIVFFDDTIQVVHYAYSIPENNTKAIFFSNGRSLYNQQNFLKTVLDEKKSSIELQYKFTFTNEDYIYAKDN